VAHGFDPSNAPFDRLTAAEIEVVRAALDIGYFRPGETLVGKAAAPANLFVVMKGHVEEREGEEAVASLGPGDAFDARALIQGAGGRDFVAAEETLCYLLPRATAMRLIADNKNFAAFFYTEISRKLDAAAADDETARTGGAMQARLGDLHLHEALFVDAACSLEAATRRMSEAGAKAIFVRDGARVGIVTATGLAEAAILKRQPLDAPVGPAATYDVVACDLDAPVAQALVQMTKRGVRRVAVRRAGEFVGVLEDVDLLAFVAGGAQLVGARIDRAAGLDELARAAGEIDRQIKVLRRQGVRIEIVCDLVSDLNRRLLARTFRLVAPPSIAQAGCLIVMGSEGRAEQTQRTDQDNGLILARPVPESDLEAFRETFAAALARFGFPPCPGGVMAKNPQWSKPVQAWRADIALWTAAPSQDAHMNLAILCDAQAVAGDPDLLRTVKADLYAAMQGEPARLAHFARAVDLFPTPIGLFNALSGEALDLKKGGIFPIVHGVRALALERGVEATNTARRIADLADLGALAPDFAPELTQALFCLMTLKLDAALGLAAARVTAMDRDLLRDALRIVKQFKDLLRRRFNLGLF
jgi:CBS domain-containing protein